MKKKISEKKDLNSKNPSNLVSSSNPVIADPRRKSPSESSHPIRNPSIDSNGRRPQSLRSEIRYSSTTQTEEQAKWQEPFKLEVEMKPCRPVSASKHCFFLFCDPQSHCHKARDQVSFSSYAKVPNAFFKHLIYPPISLLVHRDSPQLGNCGQVSIL